MKSKAVETAALQKLETLKSGAGSHKFKRANVLATHMDINSTHLAGSSID